MLRMRFMRDSKSTNNLTRRVVADRSQVVGEHGSSPPRRRRRPPTRQTNKRTLRLHSHPPPNRPRRRRRTRQSNLRPGRKTITQSTKPRRRPHALSPRSQSPVTARSRSAKPLRSSSWYPLRRRVSYSPHTPLSPDELTQSHLAGQ